MLEQMTMVAEKAHRPGRRLRIFLARCAETDENHIREILTGTCFDPFVESLHDRESLAARLAAAPPDLLMACEEHSVLNPAQVLEIAQKLAPRTPVIIFSQSPTEEAAVRAIE